MPNTVLGKVSVVPRGDYSASTTYYALDIVGYNGGSYLAMKEVTGVTPSNDGVNWMQLSGPGLPGENGTNGVTFTPSVSEAGVISWTNDGGEDNPDPVNIMGPAGAAAGFGTVTATADNTSSETPSVDVQSSGPDTAKNFTFAFTGLKGNTGETPNIEIGTVNTLEPGQDATADITGTTPNLTLSLGIPKGQPGTSVSRIQRTSGTGAAGTTDTYTMYDSNDDAIGTFTVYNGANGAGAGDFMADGSVPMTGPLNMGGNKITNLGAPGADTDAVRKSDLDAVAAEVDGILDGTTPVHLSPATDTKIGGVIIGEGLSVEADGTVSADDQLPAGGTQGQVLTKTASGTAWDDVPSDLPSGGTDGQILTKTTDGVAWEDAPAGGVASFKGRTGAVTPQEGDYTADMVGARPNTWTPSAADVGAIPNPFGGTAGQILEKTATGTQWADKPEGSIPIIHLTSTDGEVYTGNLPGLTSYSGLTAVLVPDIDATVSVFKVNLNNLGEIELVQDQILINADPGISYDTGLFKSNIPVLAFCGNTDGRGDRFHAISIPVKALYDNSPVENSNRFISSGAVYRAINNAKPDCLTAVLSASGWSGNSQTITVNGVITNTSAQDIDISCADKASADAWAAGGVWCSDPTQANKLTFTCTTPPTATINLNIRLWEVG